MALIDHPKWEPRFSVSRVRKQLVCAAVLSLVALAGVATFVIVCGRLTAVDILLAMSGLILVFSAVVMLLESIIVHFRAENTASLRIGCAEVARSVTLPPIRTGRDMKTYVIAVWSAVLIAVAVAVSIEGGDGGGFQWMLVLIAPFMIWALLKVSRLIVSGPVYQIEVGIDGVRLVGVQGEGPQAAEFLAVPWSCVSEVGYVYDPDTLISAVPKLELETAHVATPGACRPLRKANVVDLRDGGIVRIDLRLIAVNVNSFAALVELYRKAAVEGVEVLRSDVVEVLRVPHLKEQLMSTA